MMRRHAAVAAQRLRPQPSAAISRLTLSFLSFRCATEADMFHIIFARRMMLQMFLKALTLESTPSPMPKALRAGPHEASLPY